MPPCPLPRWVENKCVLIRFGVRPVVTSRAAFLESVAKGHQLTGHPLRQSQGKPGWVFSASEYGMWLHCVAGLVSARKLAGGWRGDLRGEPGWRGLQSVKVGPQSWNYEVFELDVSQTAVTVAAHTEALWGIR